MRVTLSMISINAGGINRDLYFSVFRLFLIIGEITFEFIKSAI